MKAKKTAPFQFVLDELESLSPYTKPMFGCTAIYVDEKIVLILRDRETSQEDNGIWIATTQEHHASLKREFPMMRSIQVFGPGVTGWQVLPADDSGFEEAVLNVCSLIRDRDSRIGKIPAQKKTKKSRAKKSKNLS